MGISSAERGAPAGPTGLAVAHPGHEIRLSRWIADKRPSIHILTAGSRSGSDTSRVDASRALARQLGLAPGSVFGRYLDRDVYGWIMASDARPFVALAQELCDSFVQQDLRTVVTDSWQLYNVVHDLWSLTVRAATATAAARLGRRVECLDYPVVPEALAGRTAGPVRLRLDLSPCQVAEKLRLAAAYPAISGDVADILAAGGREFLSAETLHAPRPLAELLPRPGEQPLYEIYGEARVAVGLYGEVLRWPHVAPIVEALGVMIGEAEAAA